LRGARRDPEFGRASMNSTKAGSRELERRPASLRRRFSFASSQRSWSFIAASAPAAIASRNAASFIVVDELHAFMLGPRGLHLASLLKRIDSWSQKPARRIGLSATIGDLGQAAAWLRPSDPSQVVIMQDVGEGLDLKLQIRGYLEHVRTTKRKGEESAADAEKASALG
jgi:Lhr-like helicase